MANPQITPIYQLDQGDESFYAPIFEVRIEGRRLPRDVVRDVMEVTYKDNVNEIDSFEFKRLVESGDEVIVTYESERADGGRFRNTEVLTFRGDTIRRAEVYFGWDL